MASTRVHAPRCIAGMTFFVAIRATPSTPHRSLFVTDLRNRVTRAVIRCAESCGFPAHYPRFMLVFALLLTASRFPAPGCRRAGYGYSYRVLPHAVRIDALTAGAWRRNSYQASLLPSSFYLDSVNLSANSY